MEIVSNETQMFTFSFRNRFLNISKVFRADRNYGNFGVITNKSHLVPLKLRK